MSYPFAGRYFDKYKPFFPYELGDYSFKVDLQYGELLFTRKLISFSGRHLPLDLSLKYIQRHADNGTMFSSYSGFPKGFKTNYHVFLEYDSTYSRYLYEDSDGFQHIFILAVNSSTLYYDTFGSGLMLEVTNNGFVVFDDDENYQEFDQYGRLTLIHKKITSNHSAEQEIHYLTSGDLKIDYILDNYGRRIDFDYTGSYITIFYNNNTVITLHTSNACLAKISKNIGGNHIKEDIVSQIDRVSGITLPNGQIISFSYSGSNLSYLHVNSGQEHYYFAYNDNNKEVIVTNARNVSTAYSYSQEQTVSQTSENNSNLSFLKINSDITSATIKDASNNSEITEFLFNNLPSIDIGGNSFGSSDNAINNNLQTKRMYLFYAEINGNLASEYFELRLYDYDNNYLANLVFKDKTRILSFPVGIKESLTQKQFHIDYLNFSPNNIEVVTVKLIPLLGDFEALFTNVDMGGPIFFYGDTPYYHIKKGVLDYLNTDYYSGQEAVLTYDDYLKNEKLFYKRNGNSFHLWFNDYKTLIIGVNKAHSLVGNNKLLGYDSLSNSIGLYDASFNLINNATFYKIKGDQNNAFSVTKISHNSASFHTGYTSFYYEEEETKYIAGNTGYVTYYDYDENYSLMEVNRDDGYKEEYSYDSNGNLADKTISQPYSTKKIKTSYDYDSNDNLTSDSKLVGSSFVTTSYSHDNFGNISLITNPNGLEQGFDYDNITGERNLDVDFGENSAVEMVQNNTYVDGSHHILNQENNSYYFAYSSGQLSSVSYNNQSIVSFTYQSSTYQGVLLYTGVTTSYNNNYSFVAEYDAYDRISYIEGIRYYYDGFGRITSYSDNNLGTPYAITSFTYDYYDQKESISIMHTGLSNELTYDNYRRLINQTYKRNNNNLYDVTFTYYSNIGLENVIKQSVVHIGSSSLRFFDDMDSFSRLTSKSIAVGNNDPYTQHISYYVGGPNNGYTNSMVESVYTEETIPGPFLPITITEGDYYTYDSVGNIITIAHKINNTTFSQIDYIYDAYSRLKRENNQPLGKTIVYDYNDDGNITSKIEYAYTTSQTPSNPITTHSYNYDLTYPNRLTSFDNQPITYDNIGNPLTYRGKTLSWTRGILLSSVDDGTTLINLEYDGFKQRVRKSINSGSSITNYRYINNQLILEERDNGTITYLYAHSGVVGFKLSGFDSSLNLNGVYYYEKNIQQDVIAIRNTSNNEVAIYKYDAYGNHKVCNPNGTEHDITDDSFIGNINPIRYRSYYYDTDLKMYWLTTRYYDPEVGRFISPDHYSYLDYQKLHGLNLYAYSKNNPVMYYDPSGHFLMGIFAFISATYITLKPLIDTAIIAKAAIDTINDERHIKGGDVYVDQENTPNQITNSYLIKTPWKKIEFLFKYKYGNKNSPIKGTILGAWFEWECHNITYEAMTLFGYSGEEKTSAASVDFDETIFNDPHDDWKGKLMKVGYWVFGFLTGLLPICQIDYIIGKKYRK